MKYQCGLLGMKNKKAEKVKIPFRLYALYFRLKN